MLSLQVQQQTDELNTLLKSCEHVKALEAFKKHLTSAVMVLKTTGYTFFQTSSSVPEKKLSTW